MRIIPLFETTVNESMIRKAGPKDKKYSKEALGDDIEIVTFRPDGDANEKDAAWNAWTTKNPWKMALIWLKEKKKIKNVPAFGKDVTLADGRKMEYYEMHHLGYDYQGELQTGNDFCAFESYDYTDGITVAIKKSESVTESAKKITQSAVSDIVDKLTDEDRGLISLVPRGMAIFKEMIVDHLEDNVNEMPTAYDVVSSHMDILLSGANAHTRKFWDKINGKFPEIAKKLVDEFGDRFMWD